jgi:hypothetical protein
LDGASKSSFVTTDVGRAGRYAPIGFAISTERYNVYDDIRIRWKTVWTTNVDDLESVRCLYAYVIPTQEEIIYLGKADRHSVMQRWKGSDKHALHEWADRESIDMVRVHVGFPSWGDGRYSPQKLADVESLLIFNIRPPGNIACLTDRIARPGLRVRCIGDWPDLQRTFIDS